MSLAVAPVFRFGTVSLGRAIPSISLKLPALEDLKNKLSDTANAAWSLWDGLLLAAPKKKVSHQKRRQKLLGPAKKQLKVLNNLNRCPSCGHYKRAHTLCMNCVIEVKNYWRKKDLEKQPEGYVDPLDLESGKTMEIGGIEEDANAVSKRLLYAKSKKVLTDLNHTEEDYVGKYPRTLPVEKKK